MMGYGGWGWMGGIGMGLSLVLWIAIIALIIWAVVRFTGNPSSRSDDPATEILKRRYARGEITRDEFEQAKQVLSG